MSTQIPYLIQFAHPDNKRPYIDTKYGSGTDISDIGLEIEREIYNYIIEHSGRERLLSGELKSYEDIRKMIYSEFYMDNAVINIMIFMNNKWKKFQFDYEDYLSRICEKEKKN